MSHTPFGYVIKDGKAEIDDKEAEQLRDLYHAYLSGLSLKNAAEKTGIKRQRSTIARMLTNERYLGDEFYPQIIDEETFKQVAEEKLRRVEMLGRIYEPKKSKEVIQPQRFTVPIPEQLYDDPFKQAEYVYNLFESEMIEDGD